jgi:hypothetical protein
MPDLNPVASLDAQLAVLGLALAQWRVRDDSKRSARDPAGCQRRGSGD